MGDDMILQVFDWDQEDVDMGDDGEEFYKYRMHLYGRTKENKTIYVQVNDFTPYFMVEIPQTWKQHHVDIFMKTVTKQVWFKFQGALKTYDIISKFMFEKFNNYENHHFLRMTFHSYKGFRAYERVFKRRILCKRLCNKPKKYKLCESNIEPMLRCMHIKNLKACGWIKLEKGSYKTLKGHAAPTINDINIKTRWSNLKYYESDDIMPIVIASFDIECTSGDGTFPQATRKSDKIIQIGTTFHRYGETECFRKHIITLGSCDPIDGVDVESYKTEQEVLLAWTKLIENMNPDVITGYNIFGFDYAYMQGRAEFLNIQRDFSQLCRVKGNMTKLVDKTLASSALGQNQLKYYATKGRIQVDLFKFVQANYRLGSYKLDNVASEFIREKVKNITIKKNKKYGIISVIDTGVTYGLKVGQYVKIYYNDGLSDNKYQNGHKFKIIKLTDSTIKVIGKLDKKDLKIEPDKNGVKYKVFWCQAKDDVAPKDIFQLQKGTSADRCKLARYCVQDCELVSKLINKLQVITNNIGMSNVCSVPLSYLFLRGQGVKIFSLVAKKCREANHVIPVIRKKDEKEEDTETQGGKEEEEGYEGAIVFEPEVGVHYEPVAVLDYASLYPSSMIHRNISHECHVTDEEFMNLPDYDYYHVKVRKKEEDDVIKDLNKYMYTFKFKDGDRDERDEELENLDDELISEIEESPKDDFNIYTFAKRKDGKKGILPQILSDLLGARSKTKKLMKAEKDPFKKNVLNGLQLAYKVTANSLYGQTGALVSSICCIPIAASTTATGREMLNAASIFAEKMFFRISQQIMDNNYSEYKKLMNCLFNKQLDELLGSRNVKKLKRDELYDYIQIYREKCDIDDSNFEGFNKEFIGDFVEKLKKTTDKKEIKELLKHYFLYLSDDKMDKKMEEMISKKEILGGDIYIKLKEKPKKQLSYKKKFMRCYYDKIKGLLDGKIISPKTIYGDTDSIFVNFHIMKKDSNEKQVDKAALITAIQLGVYVGVLINYVLPAPQNLEYEKTFWPFCILTKKRYVGNLYEFDPDSYKQKSMGIVLKRRDNAPIVKIVCGGIIQKILNERSAEKAVKFLQETLAKILSSEYPLDKFVITKTFKTNYKDRSKMVHAVLADRMGDRDPGNKPQSNDRIPFAYIESKHLKCLVCKKGVNTEHCKCRECLELFCTSHLHNHKKTCKPICKLSRERRKEKLKFCKTCKSWYSIDKNEESESYFVAHEKKCLKPTSESILQGDIAEHPKFIVSNNLRLDYLFYITKQIMKPSLQFLELLVKNPKRIFEEYIMRENNRKKGIKPVDYYIKKKSNNTNGFSISDHKLSKMITKKPHINVSKSKIKMKKKHEKYVREKEDNPDLDIVIDDGKFVLIN